MKYFTLDWWNGIQEFENGNDPLDTYDSYIKENIDRIPAGYIKLYNEIFIHDGELIEVDISISDKTLNLLIHADDGKGNLRKVELLYVGVSSYKSTSSVEKGLPGPLGYGDLGYHEIELLESGYEHRILFSSGIEFQIQFENMELKYT